MVNQDIVKYLQEGLKRGFKIPLLRQKLLEGGFKILDVDEAVKVVQPVTTPDVKNFSIIESDIKKDNGMNKPFENKIIGGGKTDSKMKWMKFAGISGIALLALSILSSVLSSVMPTLFENKLVPIIFALLSLVLIVIYYSGFVKIGKRTDEKKIKIGAWMNLIGIIIFAAVSVLTVVLLWSTLSSLMINPSFSSVDVSSIKTVGIVLGILGILAMITIFAGQIILALGLIKINSQVRFGKWAGLLRLIFIVLSILLIVGSVVLMYSLIASLVASISSPSDILSSISAAVGISGILVLVGWGLAGLLGLVAWIFEILVLFGASKKFEN